MVTMKYLQDIIQERQSACFKKHGAFFAFSDKQFNEAKDPNIPLDQYCNGPFGMIMPKDNAKAFGKEINQIIADGMKEDIELHGVNAVIVRELNNHEAYYTGDISSTVEALYGYPGIDRELIANVFKNKSYDPDNE